MYARTPRDLGLIIKNRRRALRLGQQELADRVGVSRQWIVEVEKGKQRAEVGLLLKTLTALGLVFDVHDHGPDRSSRQSHRTVDIDAVVRAARRVPSER
jgi:HTH-type transcriptional regulator/antitoxin HipB